MELSYLEFASDLNPNGIGAYILCMWLLWILYFVLILLIDFGIMGKCCNDIKKTFVRKSEDQDDLDSDVKQERERVNAVKLSESPTSSTTPVLLVDNLKKTYGFKFHAVKGISFAVSPGECFGMLGINGAGKSTMFKMLTGEIMPTSGTAYINQYNLQKNKGKYLKQIGYCPQFDAIIELLTGAEMIYLYGLLRGLDRKEASNQTDYWIDFSGLREYANRFCGTYSGGNKRKLSTAMALIGDPVIVFLDEPTSGVDPVSRRKLWTVLARCQKIGHSIVLTSHSMDECEALCNRLTIMVNGKMVCMGNIQYLKQKFGQGYVIMIKLKSMEDKEDLLPKLKEDMEKNFRIKLSSER